MPNGDPHPRGVAAVRDMTPHTHPPINADRPWRVVRYGLRHTYPIREFRHRRTARLYRRVKFFGVADSYGVEPNYDRGGQEVIAEWLAEVLHIVWGMEMREHEGPMRKLTVGHATAALDAVPEDILRAARIDRSRPL